jgi:RimJ/RimL family protein N-acetyltransferase
MNPLEYLHLQLRLEGKEVINGDQLRQVEVVPDEEMPLMVIARFPDDRILVCYDEALRPELRGELAKHVQESAFPEIHLLLEFLETQRISVEVGHYKTYIFPAQIADAKDIVICISKDDPLARAFGFGDFADSMYALERDRKLVSACVSTRENNFCGEAWVYTDEQYRRRGFAQQVVQAWAKELIRAGKVPFYSHKLENLASANLAKWLGLQPVFEELVLAYRP